MGREITTQRKQTIRQNSSVTRDTYERSMEALRGASDSNRVGMIVDHKKGSIRIWSENLSSNG